MSALVDRMGAILPVLVALSGPAHAGVSPDRELIGQLNREVIAQKQRIRYLEERLTNCAAGTEAGPVYAELKQVFSGGPVSVERIVAATEVTLPADLLFATGSVSLREESAFAVDLLATALRLHPEVRVMLVGHADSEPPPRPLLRQYPTQWELAYARALAVARALIESHGIDAARLTVASRAALEPVGSNDTPEGRALNRRVVARLTPGTPP